MGLRGLEGMEERGLGYREGFGVRRAGVDGEKMENYTLAI